MVMEQNESIRHLVTPELELLYNQIAGTNFMVAYADGGGVVLDSIQDDDFQAGEGGKAVIPGSVWMESHRGTNALGLAIHNRLFSEQFCDSLILSQDKIQKASCHLRVVGLCCFGTRIRSTR